MTWEDFIARNQRFMSVSVCVLMRAALLCLLLRESCACVWAPPVIPAGAHTSIGAPASDDFRPLLPLRRQEFNGIVSALRYKHDCQRAQAVVHLVDPHSTPAQREHAQLVLATGGISSQVCASPDYLHCAAAAGLGVGALQTNLTRPLCLFFFARPQIRKFRKTLVNETDKSICTIDKQIEAAPVIPQNVEPEQLVRSMITRNKPAIGLRGAAFFNPLLATG